MCIIKWYNDVYTNMIQWCVYDTMMCIIIWYNGNLDFFLSIWIISFCLIFNFLNNVYQLWIIQSLQIKQNGDKPFIFHKSPN